MRSEDNMPDLRQRRSLSDDVQKPAAVHFYDECYRQGIPGTHVHAAAMEAHGWEDKWLNDRRDGAKAPSPVALASFNNNKKRDRLSHGRSDESVSSDLSSGSSSDLFDYGLRWKRLHSDLHKDANVYEDDGDTSSDDFPIRPVPQNPVAAAPLLRPIPVRIMRPPSPLKLDLPSPLHLDKSIDLTDGRLEPSPLCLSPPTVMTQIMDRGSEIHIVENELEEPEVSLPPEPAVSIVESAKEAVLHSLAVTRGDETSPELDLALKPLLQHYVDSQMDARMGEDVEGMWFTLTKPAWTGNLGDNEDGDPMYTLGRMSFDMFTPTKLVCSLQGNFNSIEPVLDLEECVAPKSLKEEVESDGAILRTYDIVSAFTIEPYEPDFNGSPNINVHKPIKGIMVTQGYALPDPEVPNRLSIWFTGGELRPNDDPQDQQEWKRLFCADLPSRTFGEKAMVLAAKMLMGAKLGEVNPDGSMTYEFTRPLGGHGMAYVDVLYLDESMRIVRGHKGALFVFVRAPDSAREAV